MNLSWNWPALLNKISQDVPFIQKALTALLKMEPTTFSDIPAGAKRLYEVSSGKWQIQMYDGKEWKVLPSMQMDATSLDGHAPSVSATAGTVVVRQESGKILGDVEGNAKTASSAATLSETLPVNKGGTGATTSDQARQNLGVPPSVHTSSDPTYGSATDTVYGHVKLSNATDSTAGTATGVAATPAAVKAAYEAGTREATTEIAGQVRIGTTAGTVPVLNEQGKLDISMIPPSGRPVGTWFPHPLPIPPEGAVVCDGRLIERGTYGDLYTFAKQNGYIKSEQEWQSIASSNGGCCSYYSEGDGATNFRLPVFGPFMQIVANKDVAGKHNIAGIPNIKGSFDKIGTIFAGNSNGASGAFTWQGYGRNNIGNSSSDYGGVISFNAASGATTSGIYRDDCKTVQPESQNWIICVQAYSVVTNEGSVDVADLIKNKAEKDMSNVAAATVTRKGPVILSDSVSSTADANSGVAASPAAVKMAYDKAVAAASVGGGGYKVITSSGTFAAPKTALYSFILVNGGQGGGSGHNGTGLGGNGGSIMLLSIALNAQEKVTITIGAGGTPNTISAGSNPDRTKGNLGGITSCTIRNSKFYIANTSGTCLSFGGSVAQNGRTNDHMGSWGGVNGNCGYHNGGGGGGAGLIMFGQSRNAGNGQNGHQGTDGGGYGGKGFGAGGGGGGWGGRDTFRGGNGAQGAVIISW